MHQVDELTSEDRNDLAPASSSSLYFYERVRQVRRSKADIAAGTLGNLFLGSDGDLRELEATFRRSRDEIMNVVARNPNARDVAKALASHEARRAHLGLDKRDIIADLAQALG